MGAKENLYTYVGNEINHHMMDSDERKILHSYAALRYERKHKMIVGSSTALAITLTWLLTSPLENIIDPGLAKKIIDTVPMILALAVSLLSGLGAWLNYSDLSNKHRVASDNYHALWLKCCHWNTDFPDVEFAKDAARAAQIYRERIIEITCASPPIPSTVWSRVGRKTITEDH